MNQCPTCGNSYRPDVAVCPNDGSRLTPAPRRAPPPTGPPPKPATPTPPAPRPAARSVDDIPGGLTERSSASSWIFALIACLLILGAYFVARQHLLGPEGEEDASAAEPQASADQDKKAKRKKSKKRKTRSEAADGEESYENYDWSQDYDETGIVLGDIFAERDEAPAEPARAAAPPPPYQPTADEYQPDGSYKPTARWSEPGAERDVVELDLSSGSSSAPLTEAQVRSVLSVRKLAPCYDPWVQKIPQMQGRVYLSFIVAPDGHVASVRITKSQLRSRVVEKCIVDRARTFRFPRADGDGRTKFETHFDFTNR